MKHFLFPVLTVTVLVLIGCTPAPSTVTNIPSSVATANATIAPTAIATANKAPSPSSTFAPSSSPTPAATNMAEATPTQDVNALFQAYLQQNAAAQQAMNQYAIAMGFNMSDTADRLSQPNAQIVLKDGTLVTVDPQTSVPIFVLSQKDGQPTWSGDTLKILSDSMNLDFGLELDPTRDSVRDPRFSEFNTVSPSVFGFAYIHKGGLDSFNTSAIATCAQQFNNQHIVGFPLVPEVNQENTSLFNGLSEEQAIAAIEKHVQTLVAGFPQIKEWGGVNEGTWDNGQGETGFVNSPWFTAQDYKNAGPSYIPPYMETVYKSIKAANPAAIRYYSDSDVLETDGPKNTRVFNLVKALYNKGLVEKMAFHGHMRFGKNNPPPQTPEELAAFMNKLKGRMRPYIEAGIPIGINELDVIFLNGSGISEANQQTIAGEVMATTLEAYLEILGEAKRSSLDDEKKQAIEENKSFIVWGVDNTTSWTLDTKEGEGQVLFDHGKPLVALYQIDRVLFNEVATDNK